MNVHLPLKIGEAGRIADADASVFRQQRLDRVVRSVAFPRRGQQHGAAVEVELPSGARVEARRRQHGGQRGRRVVGVVPVPERVPLLAAEDGAQRVILQQQHPARCHPSRALGQCAALIRGMHQAEAVDDHIGLARTGGQQSARGYQVQPGPAVRAAVLSHRALLPAATPRRSLVPRRRRPGRRERRARCPSAPRAQSGRPPAGPGRTKNTATSAADTRGLDPGRRTAGNSHRPVARQDPGRDDPMIHHRRGTHTCPLKSLFSRSFTLNAVTDISLANAS